MLEALTFDEVCKMLLKAHRGTTGLGGDPVNRLYRKHVRAHKPHLMQDLPLLSEDTVEIVIEKRDTSYLVGLLPGGPSGKKPRRETGDPPVIVRDRGVDSIIGGGKRISTWYREEIDGPHKVMVVICKQQNS